MKVASLKELKQELSSSSQKDLIQLCLHLAKFKKENKELLTYLLYDAGNEAGYIEAVKQEIDEQFAEINTTGYYYMKKSIRKILRMIKKYIRYSKKKETEAELLIYFCKTLKNVRPVYSGNTVLTNMYNSQLGIAQKAIAKLHEDLQFDFVRELEELLN